MGLSSPGSGPLKKGRVLDHAKDVELLAEHLQLNEYAVMGTSGGGPYAMGCTHSLPSSPSKPLLRAVSLVTPLGLCDMSQAWPAPLVFLNKHLDLRWLVKWMIASGSTWDLQLSDEERLEGFRQSFDLKKDTPSRRGDDKRAEYPDMVKLFLMSSREAISQGWQGFMDDSAVLSAAPGFRVEDIRSDLPLQLWRGTADTNVSPKAGEEYAQRLRAGGNQKVELHMEIGETHGSTQAEYQSRVLEDLIRVMSS